MKKARRKTTRYDRESAHRIRVALLVLGVTEQEAAKKTGIPLARFRRRVFNGCVVDVARAFDISIDWLVLGAGATLKPHLTHTPGKIAILPAPGPFDRRRQKVMAADAAAPDLPTPA